MAVCMYIGFEPSVWRAHGCACILALSQVCGGLMAVCMYILLSSFQSSEPPFQVEEQTALPAMMGFCS